MLGGWDAGKGIEVTRNPRPTYSGRSLIFRQIPFEVACSGPSARKAPEILIEGPLVSPRASRA